MLYENSKSPGQLQYPSLSQVFLCLLFYSSVYLVCKSIKLLFICALLFSYTCSSRQGAVFNRKVLGPVVQNFVSLTSSLVVKMLTVLVSTISNSQVFLLKKCE